MDSGISQHTAAGRGLWRFTPGLALGVVGFALAAVTALAQDPVPREKPVPAEKPASTPATTLQKPPSQDPTPSPIVAPDREQPPVAAPTSTAAPAAAAATTPTLQGWQPRYHGLDEVRGLVSAWIEAGAAEKLELPPSRGNLPVPAIQFGAVGPTPLALRPTIFLLGAMDGLSLTGSEAVLSIVADLLKDRATLPPNIAFVAVPWAAPDGLADVFAGRPTDGRDHLALDDDGDLAVDEDGPDDVDKDGLVLDMIVEDANGPLVRAADPRFLAPARPGDRPRYRLWREGRDDDHDGRFNEDPIGGVNLDMTFPVGWGAPESNGDALRPSRSVPLPLDDALSRAIADLVLARPSLAVLVFQGNHGELACAGGRADTAKLDEADRGVFDEVARLFSAATARGEEHVRTQREARGADRSGSILDWIHAVPGALAFEVAAWGPNVERAPESRDVGLANARFESHDEASANAAAPPVTASDREWARWLDNTRGGIGFVDWHPVDLGDGTKALVGGWEPFSRLNAPATSLTAATAGLSQFVVRLARAAPVLDVHMLEEKRDGDVVTLRWRVENSGRLPTGLSTGARGRPTNAPHCELVLPAGARLLWGETSAVLGDLAPGSASREITSVVLAPSGAVLTLRATCGWTATTVREVKP